MSDRRIRILHASKECMRDRGFHNTSVQSIAEHAGISTGLIYRYFKNKQEIVDAVVSGITGDLINLSNEQDKAEDNAFPFHLVAGNRNAIIQEFEDNIVLLMNISAEAGRNPHYASIINNAFSQLDNHILSKKRKIAPENNESMIATQLHFIAVVMDGLIIRRRLKGNTVDNDLIEAVQGLLRRVITC